MRKVCKDYAEIFDKIEENPSCVIEWNFSDRAVIGKPQFILLDRRTHVHRESAKYKETENTDLRLPSVQNDSDEVMQPDSCRLNATRTDSDFLHMDKSTVPLQQNRTVSMIDLPNVLVDQQENDGTSSLDECKKFDNICAYCSTGGHSESEAVISNETQVARTAASGTLLTLVD